MIHMDRPPDGGPGIVHCQDCGRPLHAVPPVACASCGTMQWNDAKPCGCALVVSDSRLLLVRRAQEPWKHMWDVPGGFCNPGEHPMTTARREVREETGLDVRVIGFLGIWLDQYAEAGGRVKRTLNVFYHAVPAGPLAISAQPAEVVDAAFFASSRLPAPLAFPGHVPDALEAWRRAMNAGRLETALPDGPQAGAHAGYVKTGGIA